jgi:hypothetical protein
MICKFCNEKMPDPEPKVVVKEVQVDRSDTYYHLRMVRWVILGLMVLIVSGFSTCAWEKHLESRQFEAIIKDPQTRIEIREEPGRSPEKRFTRDMPK